MAYSNLLPGSSGPEVLELQRCLAPIDAIVGSATWAAVNISLAAPV